MNPIHSRHVQDEKEKETGHMQADSITMQKVTSSHIKVLVNMEDTGFGITRFGTADRMSRTVRSLP